MTGVQTCALPIFGKMKNKLFAASIKYVVDGKTGTVKDRLREVSNMSGIPLTLIEVALPKGK